jgi:IS1 family transposase
MAQTRPKTDRDEITIARSIFDEIVGESEREETPEEARAKKGGEARAAKLTPERRSQMDALIFLEKLYHAIDGATNRFQMSTDAFRGYDHTINEVLGTKVDYGQIIKLYKAANPDEIRYSGGDCIGVKKRVVCGNPIKENISTSYVERSNLTMRMSMQRFTRLTNAFSKKFENLNYMLAIFFVFYNFCRGHKSLDGATPAMAANISKSFWTLKDILNVAPH